MEAVHVDQNPVARSLEVVVVGEDAGALHEDDLNDQPARVEDHVVRPTEQDLDLVRAARTIPCVQAEHEGRAGAHPEPIVGHHDCVELSGSLRYVGARYGEPTVGRAQLM